MQAKYPVQGLTSASQREAVKTAAIQPLVDRHCVAMVFRILWRMNQENTWKQIQLNRVAMEKHLLNLGGIKMMFSSITGMVGKAPGPNTDKLVNPCLSYWIVLESEQVDPRAIVRGVQGVLTGQAEVKLMHEPPIMSDISKMHSTLCTVVKDHSNSYIRRRILESTPDPSDPAMPGVGLATRIITLPNDLKDLAKQTQEALRNGGVAVDVIEYSTYA